MHVDWIDLFKLLNENRVRYLVVGGYAVAFYGFERYTKDLDIWVSNDKENSKAIIKSLTEFGADASSLKLKDFRNPDKIIAMGIEPYRVEFLMGLDALDFDDAWNERVERENKGVNLSYVSRDHLIVLKQAAGRWGDQRDLEAIRSAYKKSTKKKQSKAKAPEKKPAEKRKKAKRKKAPVK